MRKMYEKFVSWWIQILWGWNSELLITIEKMMNNKWKMSMGSCVWRKWVEAASRISDLVPRSIFVEGYCRISLLKFPARRSICFGRALQLCYESYATNHMLCSSVGSSSISAEILNYDLKWRLTILSRKINPDKFEILSGNPDQS